MVAHIAFMTIRFRQAFFNVETGDASMAHSGEAQAVDTSSQEQQEIVDVYAKLRDAEAKLIGPDGRAEILPNNVYSFLLRLLADLRAGHSVTILQNKHELTTVEASKILGMSRQFLVQVLEKGGISFHMVGTHRRMYVRDVIAYKSQRDFSRRSVLNDLAKREFAKGDYDQVPDDFHTGK
jgi:excisionase family DNA binding protein